MERLGIWSRCGQLEGFVGRNSDWYKKNDEGSSSKEPEKSVDLSEHATTHPYGVNIKLLRWDLSVALFERIWQKFVRGFIKSVRSRPITDDNHNGILTERRGRARSTDWNHIRTT